MEVIVARNDWIGKDEEVGIIGTFLTDFEITNNSKDFVRSDRIEEWLEHKKMGVSFTGFANELKRHCVINKFTAVENKAKTISGKSKVVWFGIREIAWLEDNINDDKTDVEY